MRFRPLLHTLQPGWSGRGLPVRLHEIGRRSDEVPMTDGVYERIKERLLSQTLGPGQLLQTGVLAKDLGVSTTPVREALTRLAAERLLISTPRRGFFAPIPTEEELLGLYGVNEVVLDGAIVRCPERLSEGAEAPALSFEDPTPARMVQHTAELFIRVAGHCGLAEFVAIVRNLNDRLHRARMVEQAVFGDTYEEWAHLAALDASGKRDELRAAVRAYHERRQHGAGAICRELLLKSFMSASR